MSRFSGSLIGPHSRHQMKHASPYATLLLDVSLGLCQEDIAHLKMVLQVDNYAKKIDLEKLRHGSEILSFMDNRKLISRTDIRLLENLLAYIGRQDLVKKIDRYHERLNLSDDRKYHGHDQVDNSAIEPENTQPKQVFELYSGDTQSSTGLAGKLQTSSGLSVLQKTPLKSVENQVTATSRSASRLQFTALKNIESHQHLDFQPSIGVGKSVHKDKTFDSELHPPTPANQYYDICHTSVNPAQPGYRFGPDGQSVPREFNCQEPGHFHRAPVEDGPPKTTDTGLTANYSDDIEMRNSQRCSQDSQMSVSDDEKLGYYQEKALFFDGDSSSSNMQFSQ